MKQNKRVLDEKVMKALYNLGGLFVYDVFIFDEVKKQRLSVRNTLDKDAADGLVEDYKKRNFKAWVESFVVHFDGAFAKKGKKA